jgi:hypothetical protein
VFKRLRWLTMGFLLGLGSSYAVARRVRRAVLRYAPPEVVDRLSANATNVRRDVQSAVVEGRHAMRSREAQLRAKVGRRWQ